MSALCINILQWSVSLYFCWRRPLCQLFSLSFLPVILYKKDISSSSPPTISLFSAFTPFPPHVWLLPFYLCDYSTLAWFPFVSPLAKTKRSVYFCRGSLSRYTLPNHFLCMNMCLPEHKMSTQWCGRDDSVFSSTRWSAGVSCSDVNIAVDVCCEWHVVKLSRRMEQQWDSFYNHQVLHHYIPLKQHMAYSRWISSIFDSTEIESKLAHLLWA